MKMPVINPDGVSIKGCKWIYAPAGQAGEYAPLATNPYRGCSHGCVYCYVPIILRGTITREEFNATATPRPGYLEGLRSDAGKYQMAGITEQVMLSFTTDVYNPIDRSLTRPALEILREHGLGFCVLTKGGTRALADIDLYRPKQDAFASTLTSLDETFSQKWEPRAAMPQNRIDVLQYFKKKGIFTWVSLEPTLDVESSLQIVRETHEFVNLFKIGRVNYIGLTKTTDWKDYTLRMIELCQKLGVCHYFKKDLQPYLPEGYGNPVRVQQHY